VEALERSLHALVQRHETLRTTFIVRDEQPMQVIASTLSVPLARVPARGRAGGRGAAPGQ
jgi:hypothetical protein